jgi:hypothetical protein
MMDCTQYRRSMLSDPSASNPDPQLRAHRLSCIECASFTRQLPDFEARLGRAVRLSTGAPVAAAAVAGAGRRGWLAMAAGVLLAVGVAGALWVGLPRSSLAEDVVGHMAGEPQAWDRTNRISAQLPTVLRAAQMRLSPSAGLVSYANSCLFRGYRVPHLVVQSASGPVTVMVLVHESVPTPVRFDEQGYRGVILPMPGHGSVAVLVRDQDADLKSVERMALMLRGAIEWKA